MATTERVDRFLQDFTNWARGKDDILAAGLIGSYARGTARIDSDVDLVILSKRPQQCLTELAWAAAFGPVERHQVEHYGRLTSVRVWYGDGLEVEYGITGEEWAAAPLDEGTRQVISGGLVVLLEQGNLLSRHQKSRTDN